MNEYERHMGAAGDPAGGAPERTPEEIQREIELTRERMSRDIDELGEKLHPRNLKRQAKDAIARKSNDVVNNVGDQAREGGIRLFEFIRENPLPVAAAGLSAVWLIQQRNRSEISGDRMSRFAYTGPERRGENLRRRIADRAGEVRERAGEIAGGARERAGELAGSARERAEELAGSARERAEGLREGARRRFDDLGSRARVQGQRARGSFEHTLENNPLAVAAGAAVLGLMVGLLVPESEREHRLMGPTRDNLLNRAQSTAQRVKEAAVEAGNEVREAVREEAASRAPEIKATIKDAATTVGSQVKESAGRVTEEAKQAAKGSRSGGRGTGNV